MVVTATQLPNKRGLQTDDFVVLDRYTFAADDENVSRAYYSGSKLPSSESILHWYFYRKHPHIRAVVHVHENTELLYSPASRAAWERLGIIETARYGDAGTRGPAALGRGGHRGPGPVRHPQGPLAGVGQGTHGDGRLRGELTRGGDPCCRGARGSEKGGRDVGHAAGGSSTHEKLLRVSSQSGGKGESGTIQPNPLICTSGCQPSPV